jgi:myo-inositol 2-dehydrogenase/D-chiro-inositol 1-dehydrogenase
MEYIPHSGGIFRDCLIHDIDVVRYVTGQEAVSVRAVGAVLGFEEIGRLGDVDTAAVMLEMSDGTIAQLSGLRHDPVGYDVRLEVFGSKDSMAAGWSDRTPIHSAEPGIGHPVDPIVSFWDRFEAAYQEEMAAFVRVIEGEEKPAADHHDAFEALRIAVACDLSLAEGRTVLMEEIA